MISLLCRFLFKTKKANLIILTYTALSKFVNKTCIWRCIFDTIHIIISFYPLFLHALTYDGSTES